MFCSFICRKSSRFNYNRLFCIAGGGGGGDYGGGGGAGGFRISNSYSNTSTNNFTFSKSNRFNQLYRLIQLQ
jgi:hypothetical protein